MPITVNSPAWRVTSTVRGARAAAGALPGLPDMFVPPGADVSEHVTLEAAPVSRGAASATGPLDLSTELLPDQAAILAIRHPSGALTFHLPVESRTRGARAPTHVRFQVAVRTTGGGPATRGLVTKVVKAIVVKVAKVVGDKLVALVLPKLVTIFEKAVWKKKGLKEGWHRVTPETLKTGRLEPGAPASLQRSLLLIHGTFSNAGAAFGALAGTGFFTRVKDLYGDRIFAFNHFSLCRTPEENAQMIVDGLPAPMTFDVITHSRGGLVLRNLVERSASLGSAGQRFKLGHAILVASPNDGTPLATPERWEQVVGWFANILEIFPDNPFTTGAEFVASALEWVANHVVGNIPGLQAMDGRGDLIEALQSPPGPAASAYSALVANYNPDDKILARLLDAGIDQFFAGANDLVVPSAGGWQVDRGPKVLIPGSRIGCFGPGGNLPDHGVTHGSFFERSETVDFLVTALEGRAQPLGDVDPGKPLPDRRIVRGRSAAAGTPAKPAAERRRRQPEISRLTVEVHNGDLQFEPSPLMLGHYPAARLLSTEALMDKLIGGAMTRSLQAGLYPMETGSHQVFLNTYQDPLRATMMPRPEAVIVAGLGPEGSLKSANLVKTIRLAVLGWARRLAEPGTRRSANDRFDLAATLIGSGGTGVSPGLSARAIVQGVLEANEVLRDPNGSGPRWPQCGSLRLIELYLDRATEAWRALGQLKDVADEFILNGPVFNDRGGLVRPSDHGYRGAHYDFISVAATHDDGVSVLSYTLDSRRARSEMRAVQPQSGLVRELVASASNDQQSDARIGHTLFNLLIPIELEADLAGTGALQIELDDSVADIPWELLDVSRSQGAQERTEDPWAIRMRLIRKFRTATFRDRVTDADADARILVIGEPQCPADYARLDAARTEAVAVSDQMVAALCDLPDARDRVALLAPENASAVGPDAQSVLNTLYERPWRIVHIAGHGEPASGGRPGGVVLSSTGTFLGASEIRAMRTVPELVFVNCCYLGSATGGTVLAPRYNRAAFASGVARALIDIGVKCVVAAGWAVEDQAAREFAETFYRLLLSGHRFIDAVHGARKAAYDASPTGNTWAAYQCYGDPDWRFQRNRPDADLPSVDRSGDYQIASLMGLKLELDRIAVQAGFDGADSAGKLREVRGYEATLNAAWRNRGDVAYAFGAAYFATGAVEDAVRWLQAAVDATDALAPMKAGEQLANAQSRLAWEVVDTAVRHRDQLQPAARQHGSRDRSTRSSAVPAATKADARVRIKNAQQQAARLLKAADQRLQTLHKSQPTMERESLLASMYKRRALVALAAGRVSSVRRDMIGMRDAYRRAVALGQREGDRALFYPAVNCLAADLALAVTGRGAGGRSRRVRFDPEVLRVLNTSLDTRTGDKADFWSVVTEIERDQYLAMSKGALQRQLPSLERRYRDLGRRATPVRMWTSVYDTASVVLGLYERAAQLSRNERNAARTIRELIRSFAHPETSQ